MYKEKKIGVVVPAYNESKLIAKVIETMPDYVDRILVVDDCSKDDTVNIIKQYVSPSGGKVQLFEHQENQGVGGAIATGYKEFRDLGFDVTVVMAGDAQMNPDDLPFLIEPIINGSADYAKGNRLFTGDAWNKIPKVRYLGNSAMSLLTKIASGYWNLADSQSGYTAINLKALKTIDWDRMYKKYGQPNDLLVRLNINNFRVRDVPVSPIYNIGEKSGVKPIRMIPKLSFLLFRLFVSRMWQKYVIRDFHPLVFFYTMAFFLLLGSIPLGLRVFYYWFVLDVGVPPINALAWMSSVIAGLQSLFFAMWFDMEYNKDLR
ncbi:MAG: glycosyltransferase family 2 protein [Anaerolineales bacterium]